MHSVFSPLPESFGLLCWVDLILSIDQATEEKVDARSICSFLLLRNWRRVFKSCLPVRCMSRLGLPSCNSERLAIRSKGEFSVISSDLPFNALFEVTQSSISRF